MGIRGDEFDDLFARTRAALEQVRAASRADPDAPGPEPVVADAADGQVRVALTGAGTLDSITVAPRLLRDGIDEVCARIVEAVNAAIAEYRGRATAAGAVDTEALAATLREVQTDSVRRMAAFGSAVDDVVQRLVRSAGGTPQ